MESGLGGRPCNSVIPAGAFPECGWMWRFWREIGFRFQLDFLQALSLSKTDIIYKTPTFLFEVAYLCRHLSQPLFCHFETVDEMRITCRPKKIIVLVLLVFFAVWITIAIIGFAIGTIGGTIEHLTHHPPRDRQLKAFITSAYYYPKSKSLGENALALVMSINLVKGQENYMEMQAGKSTDPTEIVVMARNETTSVVVSTPYVRVTPHEVCQIITIFATVQLLPNVKSINMVADNGMAEIPFTIPSYTKRDVVVCTSPLFVSEQWQNFLFAVHIYRKFGAYMNLYLISAVTSFFELMKEYEKEGYMNVQPWVSVKFPYVPGVTADAYQQIEFRNQAAAQTDCLLQYKESAQFVTFLDLDDVLIPKLAPSFVEEFQMIMANKKKLAYIFYHKENFDVVTVRDSSRFSIKKMFGALEHKKARETGKIVVDPRNLNYTWIHFPPFLPNGMEKYEVTENVITHLKTIIWSDDQDRSSRSLVEPRYFNSTSEKIISSKTILEIEADLRKMMRKQRIREIFPDLPKLHYFSDLVVKCYNDRYYRYHYSGRIGEIKCPGPQLCGFYQHPKIKCMHVNATHIYMEPLFPITYYYATDPYFTADIGCYPH